MKTYEITVRVRTKLIPDNILWYITEKIKDALPIVSIEVEQLHDRPTSTEHHGGITNEGSIT